MFEGFKTLQTDQSGLMLAIDILF